MQQEKLLYGCEGDEHLTDCFNECIHKALDDFATDYLPDNLIVYEFRPMKASLDMEPFLQDMYETLDDNYGAEYGDASTIPDVVTAKANELRDLILSLYVPYQCERTGVSFRVNVDAYMKGDLSAYKRIEPKKDTVAT